MPGDDTGRTTGQVGSTGVAGDSTTGPVPPGELVILHDGDVFDYGEVDLSGTRFEVFAVTNAGAGPATGILGVPLAPPFHFTGGAFPGSAGTCGATLGPEEVCLIDVELAPVELGDVVGELRVAHDDGEASLGLTGYGVGASPNLLVNPGGEDQGTPPPGWTNTGAGEWVAGPMGANPIMPLEGRSMLHGDVGPNSQFVLMQAVDISGWAGFVDEGTLRVSFDGYVANGGGVDQYRVRVRYRDELGGQLDWFNLDWGSAPAWTPVTDTRLAPPGTRTLEVELYCRKFNGERCDAYFDGLELRGLHP